MFLGAAGVISLYGKWFWDNDVTSKSTKSPSALRSIEQLVKSNGLPGKIAAQCKGRTDGGTMVLAGATGKDGGELVCVENQIVVLRTCEQCARRRQCDP